MRLWVVTVVGVDLVGVLLGSPGCTTRTEGPPVNPVRPAASALASSSSSAAPAGTTARTTNAGQCPREARLDDAEDGDGKILPVEGRTGSWFSYQGKGGSTLEPRAGSSFAMARQGANGSAYAARIHGKTAPGGEAYVGLALTLTEPAHAYDLSCCRGISFWGRKAPGSIENVRFNVGDGNTVPEGGVCKNCYNEFGVDLGFSEQWQQFTIPFDWLHQQSGWGEPYPKLAADRVFHLHWEVGYRDHEFDLWIDDVQLVGCATG